jgi:hypothetical protein
MRRAAITAIIAFACIAPAHAGTFYTYAPVQGSTFAIEPASIVANGGVKSATFYLVHPQRTAEEMTVDIDCAAGTMITKSRKLVRTDLSPLRNLPGSPAPQKPDPKTTGGISLKLICDWPTAPSKATQVEAESLPAFLLQTADRLREKPWPGPGIINDRTSVANCIFSKAGKQASMRAMTLASQGKPLGGDQQVRADVDKAATACGVAPANRDAAIFAATSIYTRLGLMARLQEKGKIREEQLAAAWHGADGSLREPVLSMANLMLTPGSSTADLTEEKRQKASEAAKTLAAVPELSSALATTNLDAELKSIIVYQYFMAVGLGEVAEAKLAPQ